MARKSTYDKFSVVMLVLIVVASALLFYSENPFLFDFSGSSQPASSGGTVSLYVLPQSGADSGSAPGAEIET